MEVISTGGGRSDYLVELVGGGMGIIRFVCRCVV